MTGSIAAPHHGVMQAGPRRHLPVVIAGVLAGVGIAECLVPAVRDHDLRWLALAPIVPLVLWCALPIHRSAFDSLRRGTWSPDVLATFGIVAALAWAVVTLETDQLITRVVPVAAVSLVMVASHHLGRLAGVVDPYGAVPSWMVPAVLVVAAVTLAAWWLSEGPGTAASIALSALLIASPAALRLATPATLLASARRGAAIGVAPVSAEAMDVVRRIDTIILAKDGTVTTGELTVTSVDPVDPDHLRNMRWFAGALEHVSEHPIGRAIAKLSAPGRVTQVVQRPGQGISGSVDRHPVRVGRPSWIGIESSGGLGTHVAVEVDGRALGCITVADTVRPGAREGVEQLRGLGLDPILVSDGPSADTTHLAEQTGITTSRADLDVEGRLALIQRLQADGHVVAMVGRHAEHTAELRAADLAISTVGDEPVGGITVTGIDVQTVAGAIALTRSTISTISMVRRWALIASIAPLPLAVAGLIAPMYAALFVLVSTVMIAALACRVPRIGTS